MDGCCRRAPRARGAAAAPSLTLPGPQPSCTTPATCAPCSSGVWVCIVDNMGVGACAMSVGSNCLQHHPLRPCLLLPVLLHHLTALSLPWLPPPRCLCRGDWSSVHSVLSALLDPAEAAVLAADWAASSPGSGSSGRGPAAESEAAAADAAHGGQVSERPAAGRQRHSARVARRQGPAACLGCLAVS